jgi:putative spermidine/putrescine transport system ATP-binding protein
MAFLELTEITKSFGRFTAVDNVSLSINQGEFLTLLGPSGCGKTTLLRMIAGFEIPTIGQIQLDGEDITYRSANKRPMGMVFQSYALFPHLTAAENIAFGMNIKKVSKQIIKQKCAELLELVGLSGMGHRYPHQLSGGQQQRVAIARALAIEPKVLLLDEPLSALDAKVRVSLRNEIRRIQQQLKMTAIYVTHDQEEALSISDRIAVLAKGKIEQLDQPENIYRNPQTAFAATFVGISNQFRGTMTSAADGIVQTGRFTFHVTSPENIRDREQVLLVIRPEDVAVQTEADANENGNSVSGLVELHTFLGPFTRLHIRVDDDTLIMADIPNQQAQKYVTGNRVVASFPPQTCKVLPLDATEAAVVQQATLETV